MTAEPYYPDITVQLTGRDGNAITIIAATTRALRRAGHGDHARTYINQAMGGDYNNVLTTTMEWVNVE